MTLDNFLSFLQQLITMTDPHNAASVALARNALTAVSGLARSTKMSDPLTQRAMAKAEVRFDALLYHREDFAGKPGEYMNNQHKRQRLRSYLAPEC